MTSEGSPVAARELPRGTVTLLFTDVEGSTAALQHLGDRYGEALDLHESALREAVGSAGGVVVDTQGDAFFTVFVRARDAVSAALDAQRRLADAHWPGGVPLPARMGLHTGEPEVVGGRYVGLVVHRAARICAAAHGGQILISQATREVLRDDPVPGIALSDLGEHRLKDLEGPERLYQLTRAALASTFPPLRAEARIPDASGRPASGQRYRILGPLEVTTPEGPVALGGQKQRALLAALALRANHVVSTDTLVADLWGERPPPTAVASMQNSISQLRKLLGRDRVVTKPPGYLLRIEPGELDLAEFERLVAEGRSGAPEERARKLRAALALWRGPPLADFAYEPFAENEILRLDELRVAALEDRIDADLELGAHGELVPELEALVREHPLRERLRGQLMLALYRAGRQADALQAFHDARRTLGDELGIDPSPALQALHRSILRQEAGIRPAASGELEPDHFPQVVQALAAGRLVVVVGAAAEAQDGNDLPLDRPPAGTDIAAHLARLFEYPLTHAPELTRVSQYVALMKGVGPLYDELHELLAGDYGPGPVHRFVASLPAALRARNAPQLLVVDTNYDDTFERAFEDAGEEVDVVSYVASGRNRGRFVHCAPGAAGVVVALPNVYTDASPERRTVLLNVHGQLARGPERQPDSFVVSEDDYIDYLARADISTFIPVAIAAKLRRSHYLFLGYGVEEWRFRVFLHRIWGDDQLSYRSWAVQPGAQPLEREFWKRRGVDLLDMLVPEYVEALERAVNELAPADAAAAAP